MIRVYVRPPDNDTPLAIQKARETAFCNVARSCGAAIVTLVDGFKAIDGDFAQISMVLTHLIGWGYGSFRVSTTDQTERQMILDLYGEIRLLPGEVAVRTERDFNNQVPPHEPPPPPILGVPLIR